MSIKHYLDRVGFLEEPLLGNRRREWLRGIPGGLNSRVDFPVLGSDSRRQLGALVARVELLATRASKLACLERLELR